MTFQIRCEQNKIKITHIGVRLSLHDQPGVYLPLHPIDIDMYVDITRCAYL